MDDCCRLLSEGLDLCVRARKLDAQERTNATLAASSNPDQPILTKSGTIPLWVQVQYERDLADWERRVRLHLMQKDTPTNA